MGDKIEEYGGSICDCCAGGVIDVCLICILPPCTIARSFDQAEEGSFCTNCICLTIFPCIWFPLKASSLNEDLGGEEDSMKRCLLCTCCPICYCPCAACQFKRAVDRAKSKGVFEGGAPQVEEMKN